MKNILALSCILLASASLGQTTGSDSTISVIYADKSYKEKEPAWFINGSFVGNFLTTLDPSMIENINVVKNDTLLNNRKYYGQIYIKTKGEYQPVLISLTSLKNKYTNLKDKPVVFMLDGDVINGDYDRYVIDENYLLQIIVDSIKNEKEHIDLGLVKLLTKTEENIKKSKETRIRGKEAAQAK